MKYFIVDQLTMIIIYLIINNKGEIFIISS